MSIQVKLLHHPDDYITLTMDVEGSPLAKVALTEIYNSFSDMLGDSYLTIIREYLTRQLEGTSWLEGQSLSPFLDARFATFLKRDNGSIVSLRKPAFQRFVQQSLRNRNDMNSPICIPVFVRFMLSDSALPRRTCSTIIPPLAEALLAAMKGQSTNCWDSKLPQFQK